MTRTPGVSFELSRELSKFSNFPDSSSYFPSLIFPLALYIHNPKLLHQHIEKAKYCVQPLPLAIVSLVWCVYFFHLAMASSTLFLSSAPLLSGKGGAVPSTKPITPRAVSFPSRGGSGRSATKPSRMALVRAEAQSQVCWIHCHQ